MDSHKRRWDECCPHCGEKIDIYSIWQGSGDYKTEFTAECPSCEKQIDVVVESVPEFGMAKKEDADEWEKRRRPTTSEG